MGFFEAVGSCLRRCAVFSGRATCAEFWWFQLFVMLLSLVSAVTRTSIIQCDLPGSPRGFLGARVPRGFSGTP